MPNLKAIVAAMIEQDAFRVSLLNPSSQFGRGRRQYLGARLMPERLVPNNSYTEQAIKYRVVVANDASRYSPPQKKGSDITGSMKVDLGNQDIASEYTAEDYDVQLAIDNLNSMSENQGNPDFVAQQGVSDWFDNHITVPLIEKIEVMRWQAIVDALVLLRGDNGYEDDIAFPNPTGQRVAAGEDWSDANDDPFEDIYAMADAFNDDGYDLGALIAGRDVITTLLRHPKVITAVGGYVRVDGSGNLQGNDRRLTLSNLNSFLAEDGLPPIIPYNLKYRDQLTSHFFLKRDVMVGLALTGRDVSIDLGDDEPLIVPDTVGYVGVGRAAGQASPGRTTNVEVFTNKPPRAEMEGWQTSFPVISDPQAVRVIHTINTL